MIDGVMSLWLSLFVSLVFLLLKVERGKGGERDLCEDVCDLRVACGGGVPKRFRGASVRVARRDRSV